jgi:hypothetical protein
MMDPSIRVTGASYRDAWSFVDEDDVNFITKSLFQDVGLGDSDYASSDNYYSFLSFRVWIIMLM